MVSTDNSPQSEFQMVSANGPTSANGESLPTYHDLVQHYDLFWNTLRDFHRFSNITVKNPIMCGTRIDLYRLFVEVTSRGGLDKVIKDRKCSEVIRVFSPTATSNAAALLKKHYRKMLLKFENMYLENANNDLAIDGVINYKFENGYFITVKMGSEELNGVIYHPNPPVETRRS